MNSAIRAHILSSPTTQRINIGNSIVILCECSLAMLETLLYHRLNNSLQWECLIDENNRTFESYASLSSLVHDEHRDISMMTKDIPQHFLHRHFQLS